MSFSFRLDEIFAIDWAFNIHLQRIYPPRFFSQRWVREWWLRDRLARVLVLLVFPLLDLGVYPFWTVVGSPFNIYVWTEFVDMTWI